MLDHIIRDARRQLNMDTEAAEIGKGDGQGDPRDRTVKGNLYVRRVLPDGGRSAPISLPVHPNANIQANEGFRVRLGYDEEGTHCILKADVEGFKSTGGNPLVLNPLDAAAYKVMDARMLSPFYWERHLDPVNEPLTVVVFPHLVIRGTSGNELKGYNIRLDDPAGDGSDPSLIPGAGEFAWVAVLWKTDNTLEAFTSTPKEFINDLGVDDVMEAVNQRSTGSLPICAWLVGDDQTVLTGDTTRQIDLRQWLNVVDEPGGGGGAPTDAKYWVSESDSGLSDEVNLGALTTGMLKHTVTTGVSTPATATAGTDYTSPTGTENLTNKSIIAVAWELLIGGWKGIFTHSNTANRTYTLPNTSGTIALTSNIPTYNVIDQDGTVQAIQSVMLYEGVDGIEVQWNGSSTLRWILASDVVRETGAADIYDKTLILPIIAAFDNAQHNHEDPAGGGQITDAALSGEVSIAKGGTGADNETDAFNNLAPAAATGDMIYFDGTDWIVLNAAPDGSALFSVGSLPVWVKQGVFAVFEDQKSTNTAGGGSAATTWTTRELNTEVVDADSIVSLSSNKFTPVAGTYRIKVSSPFLGNAGASSSVRLRLRNVTAGSVVAVSNNHFVLINAGVNAYFETEFTANGTDEYDIQYYITQSRVTNGLGLAVNETSAVERYTRVVLEKVY